MQEHLILGFDEQDAGTQRDEWLAHNPFIRVINVHPVKSEPKNLLYWIGGKRVPRVSISIEYEDNEIVLVDDVIS